MTDKRLTAGMLGANERSSKPVFKQAAEAVKQDLLMRIRQFVIARMQRCSQSIKIQFSFPKCKLRAIKYLRHISLFLVFSWRYMR